VSEIKDEPAFPFCVWVGDVHTGHNGGLTKREWFAGMALQGMLANPKEHEFWSTAKYPADQTRNMICDSCYKFADAMLERRGKA
jgi:hypothetical protein